MDILNRTLFFILATLFALGFVIANLLGTKIMTLLGITLTAGTLVYPLTFLISDLVTEIWGENKARWMVAMGFCLGLLGFSLQFFLKIGFTFSGITLMASFIALVIGQLFDIRLFAWIKQLTGPRHLWLRNQTSTWISQLIDTGIVNGIVLFLGLKMNFHEGLIVILGSFCYKAFFSLLTLPFLYLLVYLIRKITTPTTYESTS